MSIIIFHITTYAYREDQACRRLRRRLKGYNERLIMIQPSKAADSKCECKRSSSEGDLAESASEKKRSAHHSVWWRWCICKVRSLPVDDSGLRLACSGSGSANAKHELGPAVAILQASTSPPPILLLSRPPPCHTGTTLTFSRQ